jgi:hypothetical protein
MVVSCFVTQLPLETNRVDLDPDVKDDSIARTTCRTCSSWTAATW